MIVLSYELSLPVSGLIAFNPKVNETKSKFDSFFIYNVYLKSHLFGSLLH